MLIQQQQKIQELTQELAASKVSTSSSSLLEHYLEDAWLLLCPPEKQLIRVTIQPSSVMSPTSFFASHINVGCLFKALDSNWLPNEIWGLLQK